MTGQSNKFTHYARRKQDYISLSGMVLIRVAVHTCYIIQNWMEASGVNNGGHTRRNKRIAHPAWDGFFQTTEILEPATHLAYKVIAGSYGYEKLRE